MVEVKVDTRIEGDGLVVYVDGARFARLGINDCELYWDKPFSYKSYDSDFVELCKWFYKIYDKKFDSMNLTDNGDWFCFTIGNLKYCFFKDGMELGYSDECGFRVEIRRGVVKMTYSKGDERKLSFYGVPFRGYLNKIYSDDRKDKFIRYVRF